MANTKIEWTDKVWNPITGCAKVSAGCENCYASSIAKRFWNWKHEGTECCGDWVETRKFSDIQFHRERLEQPLKWKKPAKIFVNSMGDLFHIDVSFLWVDKVMDTIVACPQHTFMILTKRPDKMKIYFDNYYNGKQPLKNLWLGVTAENQETADSRIPILLDTPAAKRFVSIEPMLSAVNLANLYHEGMIHVNSLTGRHGVISLVHECNKLDWVIVGGETGPKARKCPIEAVRILRTSCEYHKVPFFFKSWGRKSELKDHEIDGKVYHQFPESK